MPNLHVECCEHVPALVAAAEEAQLQLSLIALVNGNRAIRKGQVEHAGIQRRLAAALKPFLPEDPTDANPTI